MTTVITLTPLSEAKFDSPELQARVQDVWAQIQRLHPTMPEPGVAPYLLNSGRVRQTMGWSNKTHELSIVITFEKLHWSYTISSAWLAVMPDYGDYHSGTDLESCTYFRYFI